MPKRPAASKAEGATKAAPLTNVSLEALLRRTREQLDDDARRLGLKGLGRLRKDDLARRVLAALKTAAPAPRARKVPPRSLAKARTRPKTKRVEPEPETGARSKFDLGSRAPQPRPAENIPWGYGQDRITILPVDPRRLFAYWEVSDEAIEAARAALGRGGREAWLTLRVYDITGRIFDGTNAHGYFDVKVDRDTRQWFFNIGKPTSTHCVEVGLKSYEGYFAKIARSGRVDFPRAEPWGPGPVEWLSVHEITGEVGVPVPGARPAPVVVPAAAHAASPAPPATAHPPGAWTEGEYWVVSDTSAFREWALLSGWESREFLKTQWIGGHGRLEWFAAGQRFEWVGPVTRTSWEAGPFPAPVEAPGIVEERHEGPVLVQKIGEKTRVIYGPWEVVIRGVGAHAEGRVLARWEVRKSWVSDVGFEVVGGALRWRALAPEEGAARLPGASEALLAGASERHWLAGSEVRLAGASELFRVGASEFRYLGASETTFAGASEKRYRGASERLTRGASERLLRGASERVHGGASEQAYAGASERLGRGASERLGRGASEGRLGGASERASGSPYPAKGRSSRKR
ncbi:MAG TPA: DUF4912 domain-containing protein [Vicinamibacteria bacterium]|nr:DUF4912 domain-containing protein [Vicinamibacteria bacterium]